MRRKTVMPIVVVLTLLCGCATVQRRPITVSAEAAARVSELAANTLDALARGYTEGTVTREELVEATEKYDKVVVAAKNLGNAYKAAATAIELGELDPDDPAYQAKMLQLQAELSTLVADLLELFAKVEAP